MAYHHPFHMVLFLLFLLYTVTLDLYHYLSLFHLPRLDIYQLALNRRSTCINLLLPLHPELFHHNTI